ncbi:hypothetical protein D3C77_614430 [compost metagenome]
MRRCDGSSTDGFKVAAASGSLGKLLKGEAATNVSTSDECFGEDPIPRHGRPASVCSNTDVLCPLFYVCFWRLS